MATVGDEMERQAVCSVPCITPTVPSPRRTGYMFFFFLKGKRVDGRDWPARIGPMWRAH